jgi:hypothetical protein
MEPKKALLTLGASIAGTGIARAVSAMTADDIFGVVGLERRRSHFLPNLGLLGLGVLVGAGAALLVAPGSGRELRARLGREIDELGDAAAEAARKARAEAPSLMSRLSAIADSESAARAHSDQS